MINPPQTMNRRTAVALAGVGASLLLIRPKIGYGDSGLEGQSIYAAEITGQTNQIVVLTQTENGNSQVRTAQINNDGTTTVGQRVDQNFPDRFTALDLASNQSQASALVGAQSETIDAEDTNDFNELTEKQQIAIEEEPFHPYGLPTIETVTTEHPAWTKSINNSETNLGAGFGVLTGQAQLGSITIEVLLRPDGEEADHLNQLDVVVGDQTWTLTTEERLLGTASVYARSNERPFIVADTEQRDLLVWQAGEQGWEQAATLQDAQPNSARLTAGGELVALRGNENVLEPVLYRDGEWKTGDKDQRQDAEAGAIPVRNGEVWLSTSRDGSVKAIQAEPK